jgi:hypothetical protein
VVSWGWLFALAAGLGLAAAAGVVTSSDTTEAGTADVVPAALIGGGIALAIGVLVVRLLRERAIVQSWGAPATLVVIVACGTLIGVSTQSDAAIDPAAASEPAADGDATVGTGRTPAGSASVGTPEDRDRGDITDFQGSIVLLGGLVLLASAALFLMRRSELRAVERNAVYLRSNLVLEDEPPDAAPDDATIADVLARSLDELISQSDPRLAIRAAYGSLLNELAAIGVARHRYEGPAEHVRRCLSAHPLPAASINELVELFEIARFSRLPVSAADAERARHVLTEAIDALTGVSA